MNKLFKLGLGLVIVAGLASCKAKQSEYQNVYQAAQEARAENNNTAVVSNPSTYPVITTPSNNYGDEKVRVEKVSVVNQADAAGLRAYSVVVASLAVKPGAEALKAKLEAEGNRVILVQNEQGMYRVIMASFDDKGSAVEKRNEIRSTYEAKGATDYLRRTYGIPFDDLWILQRQY
ncbi:SPOR domain-containing protein [Dysgonomonas sp. 216]|uniref:SPOR domain-containing protein n=1 Tax=Dysgonomonas sp. 216 TaxID=2302934 RepID=UPI0013D376D6|nr:SPOR domain-containing protein [Dysgonomonas sp. 216]NDW18621.1 SPOR domain-containing protein [Dysgonomonas sp. 216]